MADPGAQMPGPPYPPCPTPKWPRFLYVLCAALWIAGLRALFGEFNSFGVGPLWANTHTSDGFSLVCVCAVPFSFLSFSGGAAAVGLLQVRVRVHVHGGGVHVPDAAVPRWVRAACGRAQPRPGAGAARLAGRARSHGGARAGLQAFGRHRRTTVKPKKTTFTHTHKQGGF